MDTNLGALASFDTTEASCKRSITYHQKAKAIYNLLGLRDTAKLMKSCIATLRDLLAGCDGDGVSLDVNASTLLVNVRYNHEFALKTRDLTSEVTLQSGLWCLIIVVRSGLHAAAIDILTRKNGDRQLSINHPCSPPPKKPTDKIEMQ